VQKIRWSFCCLDSDPVNAAISSVMDKSSLSESNLGRQSCCGKNIFTAAVFSVLCFAGALSVSDGRIVLHTEALWPQRGQQKHSTGL
jgi:hypothetical protein